jgi:hypothetical protein
MSDLQKETEFDNHNTLQRTRVLGGHERNGNSRILDCNQSVDSLHPESSSSPPQNLTERLRRILFERVWSNTPNSKVKDLQGITSKSQPWIPLPPWKKVCRRDANSDSGPWSFLRGNSCEPKKNAGYEAQCLAVEYTNLEIWAVDCVSCEVSQFVRGDLLLGVKWGFQWIVYLYKHTFLFCWPCLPRQGYCV